jgi:hypothetical protein
MTLRLGLAGLDVDGLAVWNLVISPQAAVASAADSTMGAAQIRRLILLSRRPTKATTTATLISPRGLIPAKHLDLPYPEHLNSRAAMRLNEATHPNPAIF